MMETGIITISDNKKDFTKEKVNDSAQMRCLMFQSPSFQLSFLKTTSDAITAVAPKISDMVSWMYFI